MSIEGQVISFPYIFQVLYVLCFTGPRYQVSVYRTIGPLVFIFRFTDPLDPIFRKLKKKEIFFFQFYFCIFLQLMPVRYWSSIMFFRFVFSTAARLIKLPQVTAPGEILPFELVK